MLNITLEQQTNFHFLLATQKNSQFRLCARIMVEPR